MAKWKYYFMPSRWRSVFIWLLRELLKKLDESEWTPEVHEIEQYMYRYLTCEDCMAAGECQHSDCKCKMPARAHVRTDICPVLKWGPFYSKERWEKFCKHEGLKFYYRKKNQDVQK